MGVAMAVAAIFGCCVLSLAAAWGSRTAMGRYLVVSALIELDRPEAALSRADQLVEEHPGESWHYYRVKAQALRHLERVEDSLAVYDEAVRRFPDEWWAHSHRCYYSALLTGDAATHLADCDRAIELDPGWPAVAFHRRAFVRALSGDLDGASEDFETALGHWRDENVDGRRDAIIARTEGFLETLRAGENPITADEVRRERARHE